MKALDVCADERQQSEALPVRFAFFLPPPPQDFIFAHFYPTCRNTSGVERATRFITKVLGDGRVAVVVAVGGGGGSIQKLIWKSEQTFKSMRCAKRVESLDWPLHQSGSAFTEARANFSHVQTHKWKSSTAGGNGFLPDKNKNRNLASTGVHWAESRALILMNDWNIWQGIHINPAEDIHFPITIM